MTRFLKLFCPRPTACSQEVPEAAATESCTHVIEPGTVARNRSDNAHTNVLLYHRALKQGRSRNPDFESKSLACDLNFDTLNFAEMVFSLVVESGLHLEDVCNKMKRLGIEIPRSEHVESHGGWSSLPNLCARFGGLFDAFSAADSRKLLVGGVCGPGNEVGPFRDDITVGFLVEYCRRIGL